MTSQPMCDQSAYVWHRPHKPLALPCFMEKRADPLMPTPYGQQSKLLHLLPACLNTLHVHACA